MFSPRLPQSKAFTELKKVCGTPSTTRRNRKWTQLFTSNKLTMMLVLRRQADNANKSRASIRATTPTNVLTRVCVELKRVFSPCYVIYLKEVQP